MSKFRALRFAATLAGLVLATVAFTSVAATAGTEGITSPPPAPANLRVTSVSCTSVSLAWDAATGAEIYDVFQGTILRASVTSLSATVPFGAGPNTFTVRARNASGSSGPSNAVSPIPPPCPQLPPPTNLRTTSVTCTSVTLAWNPVPGAARYDVFRNGALVVTVTATTATVPVSASTTYSFTVRARSATGLTGAPANLVATTPPCP
jgi:chitodextrinase